jgi:DNA-directed RNA polymerase III subunit RPC6
MLKRTAAPRVLSSSIPSAKKAKIQVPDTITSQSIPPIQTNSSESQLREEFIAMFTMPAHVHRGVSNSALKEKFGNQYIQLAPIINEMTRQSRLTMSKLGDELCYNLVSEQMASKFTGLDMSARLVYQVIEKAGNKGVWTRDIRTQTNIQQQALNKIFKTLETRSLIKPVKSVTAKQKKLYMLYELNPAKEITGGAWYTDMEFDHEFIHEIRTFILHCIKSIKNGQGASIDDITDKVQQANISRVALKHEEVEQLVQALVFDFLVERRGTNSDGDDLFILVKRTTVMSDFKCKSLMEKNGSTGDG